MLGNHDYNGKDLEAELKYTKHGWRIDDYFWAHTTTVGTKTVAFIHIDTNYLAYGPNGEPDKKLMPDYFKKNGWSSKD